MTDDQLDQQPPIHQQGDNPPEDGTRSDIGASAPAGVAPGGRAVRRAEDRVEDGGAEDAPRDPLDDVEHPTADE
ncbi:MAG TPA: hypothetical protein VM344_08765 [Vitreimonas sp.]|nr:hypothetical protein [Vitreimonas sp.]